MADAIVGFIPFNAADNVRSKLPTIIIGSLTLVASLSWNDAFQSLINQYVPEEYRGTKNAWIKVLYAFVLTLVIIVVMSAILKYVPENK